MSNLIDSPKLTIEKLLNDPISLQVPIWQRFYSWTSNEVEEYWYDVTNFASRYQSGASDYFIGTVIVVAPVGRQERLLLDGQQRIATSVILLCRLREAIADLSEIDSTLRGLDLQIEERCIRTRNFATGEDQRRLKLTEQDDAFFERHIVGNIALPSSERRLKPSQKLLHRASQFFREKLHEAEQNQTPDEYKAFVVNLQQRIRDNVAAIAVTMDDEENAISVFETLNDRGISLSTSELVRAYLLQKAPSNRPSIISLWQTIFDLEGQPRLKNLLRHLWISRHGDVKARGLSKIVKEDLDMQGGNASHVVAFAQDMADRAIRYAEIVSSTLSDPDLNVVLGEVAAIGAQALYPTLLSAIDKWPNTSPAEKSAIRKYAQALVNGYFRHVVVGDREGTKLEKLVYSQARQISEGLLGSVAAVQQVHAFVPNDAEFELDFRTKSVTSGIGQYILRKFESHLRGPNSPVEVGAPRNVHVEHVYPQNPDASWKWDDHDEWVNRIGNLTLLSGAVNRSLANSPYEIKRPIFESSAIRITEELSHEYSSWSPAEIDIRQDVLARRAPIVWPAPVQS